MNRENNIYIHEGLGITHNATEMYNHVVCSARLKRIEDDHRLLDDMSVEDQQDYIQKHFEHKLNNCGWKCYNSGELV